MIDLKPFCGENDIRYYLNEPFSEGEFTYATNGHLIVRVPKIDGVGPCKNDGMEAQALFDKHPAGEMISLPDALPPIEFVDCDYCDAKGKVKEDDFLGPCVDCNGTGKVKAIQGVDLRDGQFAVRYLHLLKALPNCVICPNGNAPAPFTFDGGDGLLMPMRKA